MSDKNNLLEEDQNSQEMTEAPSPPLSSSAGPSPAEDRPIVTSSSGRQDVVTCRLVLLTMLAAIGGFLFGYDTGVVSGAMLFVKDEFKLDAFWQEFIVSATIGAAAVFALLAGVLNNILGRKPVVLIASTVFTAGAVMMGAARSKEVLLGGRMIVGAGIGLASMTVPVYIAESAPAHIRGKLVTVNNLFITGGQFTAGLVAGAFNYERQNGWRYMLGLAGVPSLLQLVGFMFMPESPRWLVSQGRTVEARKVLEDMRGGAGEMVDAELAEVQQSHAESQRAMDERAKQPLVIQMLRLAPTRRALFVGCGLQMFQQIIGINTIMYYSATIIRMSGVRDTTTAIWLSAVTAAVNFLFTFVGIYLVDRIGRRPLTLGSMIGTFGSLIVLAIGFQLAALHSPPVTVRENAANYSRTCQSLSTCDLCISKSECGYCYDSLGPQSATNGSCLLSQVASFDFSIYGRCSQSSHNEIWAYDFCPSSFAWMATFGLVLYLLFFAPGMGPMPWTINSEIYPLWARGTGVSLATFTNWTFNLLISMTFLSLTEAITRYGAFWLYSGLCLVGIMFVFKFVPETKDKTLEEIDNIWEKEFC